ncbi:MAG TPA: methyl-accepting chemotaxis protein, partial [Pseudomonadota bacterium]|nr:methyl-accepting chemotaxis protein [Pseudomonadota bacterium]
MNHIVRGRLLVNVTLAALLLGLLFVVSKEAQAAAWPILAVVVVVIAVNTTLQVRTGSQVAELRLAMSRLVGGELEEPVPLGADEPLGNVAELMERLRKILHQRQQELSRQLGAQTKTSGDINGVLADLRNTIGQQMHALEETSASLHEMTASAKQIAQSVETLARGAEESSSSILEMAASNDEVAENMVNLAGAVQESATSIEEMTYSIREVAKNVEALSATAEETSSSMNEMDISIRQV